MHKKTWYLTGELTQDDIEWVLRSKLEVIPGEQEYLDFVDMLKKQPVKIKGKLHPAEIITTDEKEEVWLKLYFGDRVWLKWEETIPDKYFTCEE